MENRYKFEEASEIISPGLIYYRDIIRDNTRKAIALAGSPNRLWPHVKTHKMAQMVRLLIEEGVTRFKCATIAEAEMAAGSGADNVLLAYPLVGPNIARFIKLQIAYPTIRFWAIGDDEHQLSLLGRASEQAGLSSQVLIDVNMGMDRTGVSLTELETLYTRCSRITGLKLRGLHCYDGHRTEHDLNDRIQSASGPSAQILAIRSSLIEQGYVCDMFVMGGTPSFPCYLDFPDAYLSPGTLFVNDYGYADKFPDLNFTPGAAILTRVISCPARGHFTLDLGYKGIASDPSGARGILAGIDHVEELFQSEEHWAFKMNEGYEDLCPKIGDELYAVPTHICPTSALYPSVTVVEDRHIVAEWQVTARNRKITY